MEGGEGDGEGIERSGKRAKLQSKLEVIIKDPVLSDVGKNPSLSSIDVLINLEHGSAMCLPILKLDNTSFDVNVLCSANVRDLKSAIRSKVDESEQSLMGHRHISWKHVWSNFCISYGKEKLINEETPLQEFGIRNNSQLCFVPYIKARASKKHSKSRKHRFFHGLNKSSLL